MDKFYATRYPEGASSMKIETMLLEVVNSEGQMLGTTEVFFEETWLRGISRSKIVMRSSDAMALMKEMAEFFSETDVMPDLPDDQGPPVKDESGFTNSDNDGNYSDPASQTASIFEGWVDNKPLGAKMVAESYDDFPAGCVEE